MNKQMNTDQEMNQSQMKTSSRSTSQPGWLWVSAGVLIALILLQGGSFFDSKAYGEMATTSGSYSILTTDGGNDEILVVVDSRHESLMVYRTVSGNQLKMVEREELSSLFLRARARSMGRP